jgi:hypothetical protein
MLWSFKSSRLGSLLRRRFINVIAVIERGGNPFAVRSHHKSMSNTIGIVIAEAGAAPFLESVDAQKKRMRRGSGR